MNNILLRLSHRQFSFAHLAKLDDTPTFSYSEHTYNGEETFSEILHYAAKQSPLLNEGAKVKEVLCDTPVVLTPLSDFEESDCQPVYDFCRTMLPPHRVFYDILPMYNAVMLFAVPNQCCEAIEDYFGDVRFTSKYTTLVENFSLKGLTSVPHRRMFCILRDTEIDVVLVDQQQLLLINTYTIHSMQDVAYYLFNIYTQMGADLLEDEIFIIGTEQQRTKALQELTPFSKNVYSIIPSAEFNRHIVSIQDNVPYDIITYYCHKK